MSGTGLYGTVASGCSRRDLLKAGLLGGALLAVQACAPPRPMSKRYVPVGSADANGLQLPPGFTSRVVARSGDVVPGTSYEWHKAPDGGRCFAVDDGWVYVSNCELERIGGVSMLRFDQAGTIVAAARVLDGTNRNCSGGDTPWGTWLSCEEVADGRVYEVDPLGSVPPVAHLGMGRFEHEGAAVDEQRCTVYLSEDEDDGLLYRYRYDQPGDLSSGTLEAARVDGTAVTWLAVPDPSGQSAPTRTQVAGATTFHGGEGIWYHEGVVNLATKHDDKVWAYDVVAQQLSVVYDFATSPNPVLRGVDNLARRGSDLFVCEDQGTIGNPEDPEICVIEPNGITSVFVRAVGHRDSELAGPAFSPAGDRLYFSSQRGPDGTGVTYEVTGPFPPPEAPGA